MKVCVVSTAHSALDGRVFYREARALAGAGARVTVIALHDHDTMIDGIRILALPPSSHRLDRGLRSRIAVQMARKQAADIYHFHDPELLPGALWLKRVTGKPVVYDVHEHYPDFIRIKPYIAQWLRAPLAEVFDRFELWAVRKLRWYVAADEIIAERMQASSDAGIVVHNFPTLPLFPDLPAPPARFDAIYVGNVAPDRGVFTMLQAARRLCASGRAFRVGLVGPWETTDAHARALNFIAKEGLQAVVTVLPPVPYTQVPDMVRSARIGLVPFLDVQKYRKNIATKLFEYMACRVPVVASDLPPARRYLEGTGAGVLIPPGDAAALERAIANLLDNPSLCQQMGEKGRHAFVTRYNWETEAVKLVDYYMRLTSHGD